MKDINKYTVHQSHHQQHKSTSRKYGGKRNNRLCTVGRGRSMHNGECVSMGSERRYIRSCFSEVQGKGGYKHADGRKRDDLKISELSKQQKSSFSGKE